MDEIVDRQVAALQLERRALEARGLTERVAQVDAELSRLSGNQTQRGAEKRPRGRGQQIETR